MASTRKKTGGGSRTAASSKSKNTKSSTRTRTSAPAPRPFRREAGAVVCLLLAVFASFGYFNMEAIFIDFFCGILKGLLGYGYWLVPPVLLLGAYILAFHRGRPVRLRLTCALLLPLMLAGLLHGILVKPMAWGWKFAQEPVVHRRGAEIRRCAGAAYWLRPVSCCLPAWAAPSSLPWVESSWDWPPSTAP